MWYPSFRACYYKLPAPRRVQKPTWIRLRYLVLLLILFASGVFAYKRRYYFRVENPVSQRTSVQTAYYEEWTRPGPIICPTPKPAPDQLFVNTSREYKANNAYQLGSLDVEDYYRELVDFMPSQEENIRHFLQPKSSPRLYHHQPPSTDVESTLEKNKQHRIPPQIWQTGALPYEKINNTVTYSRIASWQNFTRHQPEPEYDIETGSWSSPWKHQYVDDDAVKAMWPESLKVILECAQKRPVILADAWRLFILAQRGGIYSDLDVILRKPPSNWASDVYFGKCDRTYPVPSLIVGIEQDKTFNVKPWYNRDARPAQFVQWTFGAAPGHPVMVDALRNVHSNVEHAVSTNTNFSRLKSTEILRMTGPGPFTDAVLRYLAIKHDFHWWDLLKLAENTQLSAIQIGDVLLLPRRGFNPRGFMNPKYFERHEGIYIDHRFTGSWRKKGNGS